MKTQAKCPAEANASPVDKVSAAICHLGEGPLWSVARQALYWTDILRGQIREHRPATGRNRIVWRGAMKVGGFAFTRSGGLILCSEQGVFILAPEQIGRLDAKPSKLFDLPLKPGELANDITVDPRGRILAGTNATENPGGSRLFCLEPGRPPRQIIDGVTCSNGMTFSLDERWFYHTNSGERRIDRYRYDMNTGTVADPHPFFSSSPGQGIPDGLTLDSEGCLWVAFWGGSAVRRLDPEGRVIREFALPVRQPSSVMFGGPDLGDLFITSACEGADNMRTGRDAGGAFIGGPLYRLRTATRGRPEWLAAW